jgi:hypothetical protein
VNYQEHLTQAVIHRLKESFSGCRASYSEVYKAKALFNGGKGCL